MKLHYPTTEFSHIIYVDEAGRGCLSGPVFSGAIMWPRKHLENDKTWREIKDSKKLSRKKRAELVPYIEKNSLAYSVGTASVEEIERHNILQATYMAMHRAIENVINQLDDDVDPSDILLCVDGNNFKPFIFRDNFIEHVCIEKGDNIYTGIAASSILAKEYHDQYIRKLCHNDPTLNEKYGWEKNVCYGTKQHRAGIEEHGITKHHRKTFGICRKYK